MYIKVGGIQGKLAWPLRKDDTEIREAFQIFNLAELMSFFSIFSYWRTAEWIQQFSVSDSGPASKVSHVHSNGWQSVDIASTDLIFNHF